MSLKIFGAILIVVGSLCISHLLSRKYLKTVKELQDVVRILQYLEYELNYRRTPLSEALKRAIHISKNNSKVFSQLVMNLEDRKQPDASSCVQLALSKDGEISNESAKYIERIGYCMGKFDLNEQLKDLCSIRSDCEKFALQFAENQRIRLHRYKTYALCSGFLIIIVLF